MRSRSNGGSWNNEPRSLRSANRDWNTTGNRYDNDGFRGARTLDGPSRWPHGAAGCGTERPGAVMKSEVPAPLLPRSGGGEPPVSCLRTTMECGGHRAAMRCESVAIA